MKFKPYAYQAFCIDRIIEQDEIGLFLDMGLGKTVITLSALHELKFNYFSVDKILIVAPLEPIKRTWPQEICKWDHLKDFSFSLIVGSKKERLEALAKKADIYLINRENIPWLVEHYKTKWPYDTVVLDELSSFKSHSAQRFKALKKVRKYVKRIVGLTGTPASNGYLDLFSQIYLLDKGKRLGKYVTHFRDRFFAPDKRSHERIFTWKLRQGAKEEIDALLSDLCISLDATEYITLPSEIKVNRFFALSTEARAIYDEMEANTFLPYKDADIDAPTAASMIGKLMQISGGAAYDEDKGVKILHDDKLKALDVLLEEANGQNVLIFYQFKHELTRLKERYPEAVHIKDEGATEAWNKGEVPILLAHPMSAGHGLNLQHGGHIIIWYSLTLSLELYMQANKRLLRIGQEHPVLIHHLLMEDTLDQWALENVLAPKHKTQAELLEALKVKIRGTL